MVRDQPFSDLIRASSPVLSINPYYIYATRRKGNWILIGILRLVGIVARLILRSEEIGVQANLPACDILKELPKK
jgi:hypothetical protein